MAHLGGVRALGAPKVSPWMAKLIASLDEGQLVRGQKKAPHESFFLFRSLGCTYAAFAIVLLPAAQIAACVRLEAPILLNSSFM